VAYVCAAMLIGQLLVSSLWLIMRGDAAVLVMLQREEARRILAPEVEEVEGTGNERLEV
jgi:hypothetical protein